MESGHENNNAYSEVVNFGYLVVVFWISWFVLGTSRCRLPTPTRRAVRHRGAPHKPLPWLIHTKVGLQGGGRAHACAQGRPKPEGRCRAHALSSSVAPRSLTRTGSDDSAQAPQPVNKIEKPSSNRNFLLSSWSRPPAEGYFRFRRAAGPNPKWQRQRYLCSGFLDCSVGPVHRWGGPCRVVPMARRAQVLWLGSAEWDSAPLG